MSPLPLLSPELPPRARVWLMALLTGVLVSVTELIKMHMFGIIHRLSRVVKRQIYVNYQPVSLSLIGTRVMQQNVLWFVHSKIAQYKMKTGQGTGEYSKSASLSQQFRFPCGLFLTAWEAGSWFSFGCTGAAELYGHHLNPRRAVPEWHIKVRQITTTFTQARIWTSISSHCINYIRLHPQRPNPASTCHLIAGRLRLTALQNMMGS